MEYVFGSTLVCDTLDNAKKVAFDKQVMTKTVTLGGDVFDPQGTLSGGETPAQCVCVCVWARRGPLNKCVCVSVLLFRSPPPVGVRSDQSPGAEGRSGQLEGKGGAAAGHGAPAGRSEGNR